MRQVGISIDLVKEESIELKSSPTTRCGVGGIGPEGSVHYLHHSTLFWEGRSNASLGEPDSGFLKALATENFSYHGLDLLCFVYDL